MALYNFPAPVLARSLPENNTPGFIGKAFSMMVAIVDYLRGVLPIDTGALWLKENVPLFGAVNQPSLILALGMLVLWLIASGVSNFFIRYTKLFVAGIVVIMITGYMGII